MTDSPRPGPASDPTSPYYDPYQAYPDPAYAGGAPLGPSYAPAYMPSAPAPTEPLPQYWTQTYPHTGTIPPVDVPPEPPRGPRPWLWALAGFAVAVVIGLVMWLVFVNTNPSRQETSIPAMPESSTTTRTAPRTITTRPEMPTILPIPLPTLTLPNPTTSPNTSGETETVVYEVTGEGRAINITYIDDGGMMQTEFNVLLPWTKEVELPKPAQDSASITVINSGRNVTCKISIGGVQVQERTGALLTVCSPSG